MEILEMSDRESREEWAAALAEPFVRRPKLKPAHLGDGAYISPEPGGGFVVTANHHDPHRATDRVYLDSSATRELVRYLNQELERRKE